MMAGKRSARRADLVRLLDAAVVAAAWGVATAVGIRCVARGLVGGTPRGTTDRPPADQG